MSALAVTLTIEELEALVEGAVRKATAGAAAPGAPEVLTREEVAKLLRLHPNVVVRWIRSRGLPATKIGNEWRFLRSQVVAWIAANEGKPQEGG